MTTAVAINQEPGIGESGRDSLRINNFDFVRLLAATQVVVYHGVTHLDVPRWLVLAGDWLSYFPGVPIFFVISGFLISMSWERAPSLRQYAWNRLLRIYPALWGCLLVSLLIFLSAGNDLPPARELGLWLAAQMTFFQFYNPDFLRGFGTGVLNGSLWTIAVELQFYVVLPLLAMFARRSWRAWLAVAGVSLALMLAVRPLMFPAETLVQKLIGVSLAPFLFYFVVGVVLRYVYERRPRLLRGRAGYWALAYALWMAIEIAFEISGSGGNVLNPVSTVLLGLLTVSAAFTKPALSNRILRGNDISYGVYIYHMPVINLLLFYGLRGGYGIAIATAGTFLLAFASWRLVERPALGLKRYSMRSR